MEPKPTASIIYPDEYYMTGEELKKHREELWNYLMSLKEAAIKKGMKTLTTEEFDQIWEEERAGGEGFSRVWNY